MSEIFTHAGHHIVRDRFGIDFNGYDPQRSFYCCDCHVSFEVDDPDGMYPLDTPEKVAEWEAQRTAPTRAEE